MFIVQISQLQGNVLEFWLSFVIDFGKFEAYHASVVPLRLVMLPLLRALETLDELYRGQRYDTFIKHPLLVSALLCGLFTPNELLRCRNTDPHRGIRFHLRQSRPWRRHPGRPLRPVASRGHGNLKAATNLRQPHIRKAEFLRQRPHRRGPDFLVEFASPHGETLAAAAVLLHQISISAYVRDVSSTHRAPSGGSSTRTTELVPAKFRGNTTSERPWVRIDR